MGYYIMDYLFVIAGIFIGDEKIKQYIEKTKEEGKREEVLDGHIIVTKHHNKGAILNYNEENPKGVLITSCIAFGGMLTLLGQSFLNEKNWLCKLGLSIITGGALSNLYDRIHRGYVVDYLIIPKKPLDKVIYNVSDWCIFGGSILATIGSLIPEKRIKSKRKG